MITKGAFNCNGKVNLNDWQLNSSSLLMQKEVNILLCEKKTSSSIFKIFDYELPGINVILNLKHFVRCLEAKLKLLGRHEKLTTLGRQYTTNKETDFFLVRTMVCEFLFHLREYLQSIKDENFRLTDITDEAEKDFNDLISTIYRFLNRLKYIPDSLFLYATSNMGNKCNQPEYHMYHVHLDLRWLIVSLIYKKKNSWENIEDNLEELESCIYRVMEDLIYISMKVFTTIPIADLKSKVPYSCTCARELWIMIQIFTDELFVRNKSKAFWSYINCILNQLFPNEFSKDTLLFQQNIILPHCRNPELFCIWLIYHLTLLYGYSENGEYCNGPSSRFIEFENKSNIEEIEKILRAYVNKGGKDGAREEINEELCVIIPILHVLNFEWWKSNVHIITILWDCFHKRLDQPFLMQIRGPWSTSSEKKTPLDILNQVRERIKNVNEVNESSFGLFLRFLGTFLQKNYNCTESKIWNQIKGRVYSRFSQNKIQEFSECGLYNFISLFLTLAVTADTINVCSAMVNLLPSEREWNDSTAGKKCCLIWKSKLVVLLLYNEKQLSFQNIAEHFTETANMISCRKDEFSSSMMMWFIDVLRIILMQSEDFGLYEYAFLDGWVDRYLLECGPSRIGVLISTLLKVFEKCYNLQNTNNLGRSLMINALWNHVANRIRPMALTCDLDTNFYENPTKLAIAFTLEACRDPITSKKYRHTSVSLFQYFTTSLIIKDIRITRLYLSLVLQNDIALQTLKKDINNFNTLCIQAWIKCNVLNYDINSETHFLKNYIASLTEVREILNSERDIHEFLNSNETIISFLMILSRKRSEIQSEQEYLSFDSKCRLFFHNLDRWSIQLINDENKDTKLSLWIYRCLGTIILYCAPILYLKNQPTNMLKTLINKIALPSDTSNHSYLMYLTRRIFSMIILGLQNLNIKSDISLQTLIRELFDKYLSLLIIIETNHDNSLKVSDKLLEIFLQAKSNFIRLILDLFACNFIIILGGNSTHKNCHLVMLLIKKLIRAGKTYPIDIVESIISICISPILNCYVRTHDHHPHKQQTIDLFREICSNPYYKDHLPIKEKLNTVIWSVLNKYIQTNPKVSFEFVSSIFKINIYFFKYLYSRLEQTVSDCEKNKLPNAAALRYSLNSIKRNIELSK